MPMTSDEALSLARNKLGEPQAAPVDDRDPEVLVQSAQLLERAGRPDDAARAYASAAGITGDYRLMFRASQLTSDPNFRSAYEASARQLANQSSESQYQAGQRGEFLSNAMDTADFATDPLGALAGKGAEYAMLGAPAFFATGAESTATLRPPAESTMADFVDLSSVSSPDDTAKMKLRTGAGPDFRGEAETVNRAIDAANRYNIPRTGMGDQAAQGPDLTRGGGVPREADWIDPDETRVAISPDERLRQAPVDVVDNRLKQMQPELKLEQTGLDFYNDKAIREAEEKASREVAEKAARAGTKMAGLAGAASLGFAPAAGLAASAIIPGMAISNMYQAETNPAYGYDQMAQLKGRPLEMSDLDVESRRFLAQNPTIANRLFSEGKLSGDAKLDVDKGVAFYSSGRPLQQEEPKATDPADELLREVRLQQEKMRAEAAAKDWDVDRWSKPELPKLDVTKD